MLLSYVCLEAQKMCWSEVRSDIRLVTREVVPCEHYDPLMMHTESPSWFVLSQNATANLGLTALLPALVLTIFALLVVLLRWYSKIRLMPGTWHFEDVLFTFTLLLSMGMTAVIGAGSSGPVLGGRMPLLRKVYRVPY